LGLRSVGLGSGMPISDLDPTGPESAGLNGKNMNPRTGLDEVGSPPLTQKLVLTVPQSVVHAFNIDQKYK
jgi:hypothetical protein